MIRETLDHIFKEFPTAKRQGFLDIPFLITFTVPETFKEVFPDKSDFMWKARRVKVNGWMYRG
jgi:hypothetical protein